MVKWIGFVALLVVACRKTDGSHTGLAANAGGSAALAAADAAVIHESPPPELPPKGIENSAVESVPRKDWPCRYVQTLDSIDPGGTHIATTWAYGNRTHCWIPADLAGSRGMFGCPDGKVDQNLENKVEMKETYRYDSTDHLVSVQTMAATFEYTWDGNLVRGYTLHDKVHPYAAADHGVEIKESDDTVRVDIDADGHVVKYQRIDSLGLDPTVFTWKGTHLAKLQEIGTTKIEYRCTSHPK